MKPIRIETRVAALARRAIALTLAAAASLAAPAGAQEAVVEFYHSGLDHYFIVGDPAEIADLDQGVHPGWQRTGYVLGAWPAGAAAPGAVAVCRFYGNPKRGLDSHFYSASAQECAEVPTKFPDAWLLEATDVFRAMPLDAAGTCPAGTQPVYRLFNNRSDANHRYTSSAAVYAQMVAKGYVPEGNGSGAWPVIFCVPPAPVAPLAPACSLSASVAAPMVNTGIVLTATCTNAPTRFDWGATGCSDAFNACLTGATVAGPVTYTMVARNEHGPGAPATVDVNWVTTPGGGNALPNCTLDPDTTTPLTGTSLGLHLACATAATPVAWISCSVAGACQSVPTCAAGSNGCAVTQATPGVMQYAVDVRNAAGVVRVSRTVTWTKAPQAPACTVTASNPAPGVNTSVTLFADCTESPATYTWTGCASALSTCVATSGTAGARTYGMVARNAAGTSAPASAQVTWLQLTAPAPPTCTLTASDLAPAAGASITLTAACTDAPSRYQWTGCASAGDTCVATTAAVGSQQYSVSAGNDLGWGLPATVSVAWQAKSGTPVCTVRANAAILWLGQSVLLQAECSNAPQSFVWQNCASTTSTCVATGEHEGTVVYTVAAGNDIGPGAPATTSVTWRDPTDVGLCVQFPEAKFVRIAWGRPATLPADYGRNFTPGSVLVASFTVPATGVYTSPVLVASATNRQSLPVTQQATLASQACDFRASDPTGTNGPFATAIGHPAQVSAAVGPALQPGATYYVNVRNYLPGIGPTCGAPACDVEIDYQWPTP